MIVEYKYKYKTNTNTQNKVLSVFPALSIGQHNLQTLIGGRHHQLNDSSSGRPTKQTKDIRFCCCTEGYNNEDVEDKEEEVKLGLTRDNLSFTCT